MTFSSQLKPYVERIGATDAGKACGVSRQIINAWLRGASTPNRATQVGTLHILEKEFPPAEAKRAEAENKIPAATKAESNIPSLDRAPIFGGMLKAPKKS